MGVIRGIKSFIPLQCSVASAADWSPSLVQALQTPVSLQTLPRSFVPTEPRALEKPEKSCTPTGFAALLGAATALPQQAWDLASGTQREELGRLFRTAVV